MVLCGERVYIQDQSVFSPDSVVFLSSHKTQTTSPVLRRSQIYSPNLIIYVFQCDDLLAWQGLSDDDQLANKLCSATGMVYDRLDAVGIRVRREESFNTVGESSQVKEATLESVLCFLHEHSHVDHRDIWRKFIAQIRGGNDTSLIFVERPGALVLTTLSRKRVLGTHSDPLSVVP